MLLEESMLLNMKQKVKNLKNSGIDNVEDHIKEMGMDYIEFFAKHFDISTKELPTEIKMHKMSDEDWGYLVTILQPEDLFKRERTFLKFKIENYDYNKGEGFYTLAILMYIFDVRRKDFRGKTWECNQTE